MNLRVAYSVSSLFVLWSCGACGGPNSSQPAPADPAPVASVSAPSAEAKTEKAPLPESEARPLRDGWKRVKLGEFGMTGEVDVPAASKLRKVTHVGMDSQGFATQEFELRIDNEVFIRAPSSRYDWHGDFEAEKRRQASQFPLVSAKELAPGHYTVVKQWRPGECMLSGWFEAGGVVCEVFKDDCEKMDQWADVCASLRAGPEPNRTLATPESAFPKLDPAAAALAMKVARAILANDLSAVKALVSANGLKLHGKLLTGAAIDAAFKGKTVIEVVAPQRAKLMKQHPDSSHFAWGSYSEKGATSARVDFSSGYGKQPYFDVAKQGDGWVLVEFGIFDHGAP